MRYAILSDVHANASALREVLTDAADMRAERIISLGDVLGYGPEPVEALELAYRRAHVCLAGNHDDAVAGRYPVEEFTEFAAAAVLRHRAALAQKAIDWLRHLPHECAFAAADGGTADGAFACAHGEFSDPKHFDYIQLPTDALPSWRERTEQLLFVGHTHKPGIFVLGKSGSPHALAPMDFKLEPGKRYLVNVGSVGYPRSGVCRSFYCIYDDKSRAVYFRSLPFDLDGYRAKMECQGMGEAPWVKMRAQERKPTEIRGSEAFGQPRSIEQMRTEPPPAQTRPEPTRSARLGLALVLGALLLVLGGVWCTIRLVRALREGRTESAALQTIEMTPAEVSADDAAPEAFATTLPLSGGWMAAFEHPKGQSVRIDRSEQAKATVFRLTSETNGVTRFSKTLSLFSRPQTVYYTVKIVARARPKASAPLKFETRVTFRNANGRKIGDDVRTASRSVTNHSVQVPAGAETAELQIDCRCHGTYDLAVPVFKIGPVPSRRAAR